MTRIGSKHNPAALGVNANNLKSTCVSTDPVHRNSVSEFKLSVLKSDAIFKISVDQITDVGRVVSVSAKSVTHFFAGCIMHLSLLQMKTRFRQQSCVACMIVMRVGDDGVVNVFKCNTRRLERVNGASQKSTFALCGRLRIKASVNQNSFFA